MIELGLAIARLDGNTIDFDNRILNDLNHVLELFLSLISEYWIWFVCVCVRACVCVCVGVPF